MSRTRWETCWRQAVYASARAALAGAAATLILGGAVACGGGDRRDAPPAESRAGRSAAGQEAAEQVAAAEGVGPAARGPAGPGSAPATGPASRPTPSTQPAGGKAAWKPPRFEARKAERTKMVQTIQDYGVEDQAVLAAMRAVPRHEFVPGNYSADAYADTPLPIGRGQTISQPYIVAEMTRQLQLRGGERILEIGTGSGYQAAVLTEFTPHVYTVEIIKPLADEAAARLKRLGYDAVEVRCADGYYGWEAKGPFDAIIVTAAAGQIPPPLIKQLKPGGRMVIPVGGAFSVQELMLVQKRQDGSVLSRSLMAVRFVPLTRKDATRE